MKSRFTAEQIIVSLRVLEDEYRRLKPLVADQALNLQNLKEVLGTSS